MKVYMLNSMSLSLETCDSTFRIYPSMSASGGDRSSAANTIPKCKAACLELDTCVGFDFNIKDSTCWLHDDKNNFKNTADDGDADQYRREFCDNGMTKRFFFSTEN